MQISSVKKQPKPDYGNRMRREKINVKQRKSVGERIFNAANYFILTLITICTFYPCWYVLMASVSNPNLIYESGGILLWPREFGLYSYSEVLKYARLWIGYRNTIFYVLTGTSLSLFATVTAAFALTRKELFGKNFFLSMIIFTMYFSGGLIPTFLVVRELGLIDTPLAMILPNAVSTYNLIITMSYFRSLPYELEEAAKIDGASDYRVFGKIMLPLATPIIAVIALYYGVALWNNYFTALIYLNDPDLHPLQLILREILVQGQLSELSGSGNASENVIHAENVKYAIIVVSTIPILCFYPFIQKYFAKGIMIGAIKG